MATAATLAANKKNLESAGRTSSAFYAGSSSPTPTAPNNAPITNPHDAPSYDPATDPTSSVYKATQGVAPQAIPITPQATPGTLPQITQTTQATPFTQPTGSTQATPEQVKAVAGATTAVNDLATQYRQGLSQVQGTQAPTTQGQAMGAVQNALPGQQQESPSFYSGIFDFIYCRMGCKNRNRESM